MELSLITTYLPNWDRFIQKYHPDIEFIEAFHIRISMLDESDFQIDILKKINIELGILLLSDTEINENMYQLILESIATR